MRILAVLAHPDASSFNHVLCKAVVERLQSDGHEVHMHDLYFEKFDPLLSLEETQPTAEPPSGIAGHIEELVSADGLVFVHPNWWGAPPAMLKGWIDRVCRAGVAYRFVDQGNGVGVPEGLLKAERALILNTANSNAAADWGAIDPLDLWWRETVLGMCGVSHVRRHLFAPVITSSDAQRAEWTAEAERMASDVFSAVDLVV